MSSDGVAFIPDSTHSVRKTWCAEIMSRAWSRGSSLMIEPSSIPARKTATVRASPSFHWRACSTLVLPLKA